MCLCNALIWPPVAPQSCLLTSMSSVVRPACANATGIAAAGPTPMIAGSTPTCRHKELRGCVRPGRRRWHTANCYTQGCKLLHCTHRCKGAEDAQNRQVAAKCLLARHHQHSSCAISHLCSSPATCLQLAAAQKYPGALWASRQTCEELPAVVVPSLRNTAFRVPRLSTVASPLIPSSLSTWDDSTRHEAGATLLTGQASKPLAVVAVSTPVLGSTTFVTTGTISLCRQVH